MTPKDVEYLLTHQARLLARRDAPTIDQEIEKQRQAALEIFFQWQDGAQTFDNVITFCAILSEKVRLNRELIRWEESHMND